MPGAWEVRHRESVLTAILHTDATSMAWALGFRNLILPGPVLSLGPVLPLAGMPYDMARNTACMRALEAGVDALFFLDSDVVPPRDAVPRLLAHKLPIVSGVYYRRSPPHGVPVMLKNGAWMTEYPAGKLIEVDLVGAGCLLIRREVLKKLPAQRPGKHWFDWRVDMQGLMPQGECMSEDFTFNLHCKRHGFPTVVDTSIQCRHIGFGQAVHGRMEPADATPHT